ncbi:MAG: hypothetical protein CO041_04355 [Candidatus Pacebacteria bacterium CG_4_9_14_0_2_um_filter_40_15]|nr:MAG: hypothetical protein COY01_02965 [Candidatus Pacebacteria bacterium CG_4_10_14_0_2_um_filter_40_20]PJC41507.1 MAG: hypothetical protein CO041_04355 [Candidatus Pacebacteria bacterium CG_4_9_14_0_2_um_filter_40_15]
MNILLAQLEAAKIVAKSSEPNSVHIQPTIYGDLLEVPMNCRRAYHTMRQIQFEMIKHLPEAAELTIHKHKRIDGIEHRWLDLAPLNDPTNSVMTIFYKED